MRRLRYRGGVHLLLLMTACSDYGIEGAEDKTVPFDTGEPPPIETTVDTARTTDSATTPPPPTEACNGEDDDGDGAVDEDFPDTDADGTADCVDVEECDGLDNDGDGEVDEDTDLDGDSVPDCLEVDHEVFFSLSADDAWEAWADGVYLGTDQDWPSADDFTLTLETGPHVLAVHAWDIYGMPSGFIAGVAVDRTPYAVTGDGSWTYVRSAPASGWDLAGFDDAAWGTPVACTGGWWGTSPASLWGAGAVMVWEGDCTGTGEGWFRLELELP